MHHEFKPPSFFPIPGAFWYIVWNSDSDLLKTCCEDVVFKLPIFSCKLGWSGPLRLSKSPWNDDIFRASNRYPKSQFFTCHWLPSWQGCFTFQAVCMHVLIRWAQKCQKSWWWPVLEDFFQSHSSFKDRLTERCSLSMLHLEGARKKRAEKVCFFSCRASFHGHHWWRVLQTFWLVTIHGMVVWIIFWRWHYYPQSLMKIWSLTWRRFHNEFFVGNVLLLLGWNDLFWRTYFSQLGWFNHQL